MSLSEQHKRWENFSGNINIYADLNLPDLGNLIKEEQIHAIQFYRFKNPSIKTWNVLNEFYEANPQIGLHIYWYDPVDFSFLDYIPAVRNLSVTSFLTSDFSPLLKMPHLKKLSIGETKSASTDISFISAFTALESLYIDGMKKGLSAIAKLSSLKVLTLRGIKLANLNLLLELKQLSALNLLYGSYKNLDAISTAKRLQVLQISRTRQIPDFNFLHSLENLTALYFEGMSKMEVLPDLRGLKSLKKIQLENNSSLKDITSIEQLEQLEQLVLSFPENFKAELKRALLLQVSEILLNSTTIRLSTLMDLLDEQTQNRLNAKGIHSWNYASAKSAID